MNTHQTALNGNWKMKPEEKSEIILYNWLTTKTHNNIIKEVYFNRINKLNAHVFTTNGINKKPDFLIKINKGPGEEYIAVEVKSSKNNRNIHDAGKILDYYKKYITNQTKYFINNIEVKISHFVIATENSIKGHLFKNEKDIEEESEDWKRIKAKYKTEPNAEYKETSYFVRNLWSQFKRLRKENNINAGPSVGILMCEFSKKDFSPYLMIMNYNTNRIKPKWGARWWSI